VLSIGNNHDHPADEERNNRDLIAGRIVRKCQADPSMPSKRVYDEVCDNLSSHSDDAPTYR